MEWYYYLLAVVGGLIFVVVPIFCIVAHCYEKQTSYIFQKTADNLAIQHLLKQSPYSPTFYLPTCWLKIYSWIKKKYAAEFDREVFSFPDGGQIALDSYPKSEEWRDPQSKRPILVILPGLNGDNCEPYVVYTAIRAFETFGFRSVVYNKRGFCGVPLQGEYVLSWVRENDFDLVVKHIRQKYPEAPIVTMGFSMGANFTEFYLGEKGKRNEPTGISASVAVSPPHNLSAGCAKITKSQTVDRMLLKHCVAAILQNESSPVTQRVFQRIGVDRKILETLPSIRDFDVRFTAPALGLSGAEEYYESISGVFREPYIKSPLLCISSEHDPVIAHEGLSKQNILDNPNIFQVVVKSGGHVEYSHGWGNTNWAVEAGLKYLEWRLSHPPGVPKTPEKPADETTPVLTA